jgi:hypothetical protein
MIISYNLKVINVLIEEFQYEINFYFSFINL